MQIKVNCLTHVLAVSRMWLVCDRREKEVSGTLSTSSLEEYVPLEAYYTRCLRVQGKARDLSPESRCLIHASFCVLKTFGSKPCTLLGREKVITIKYRSLLTYLLPTW